tara:strand:- start:1976 stop:3262 length:1287 start_codon:yes stop_codon:yes gene_type:complete
MLKKIKKIVSITDRFLFKVFGTDKSIKSLENINEAKKIFSYLREHEEKDNVKFVGGCVRKALNGEKIDDIDLATSLKPNDVKKKLLENDVKVIDTGVSHGTLTAICQKKKFEITTLRKDISTDGRHANVQFTSDWNEDASRRDFTINAIYADIEGRIFDPLNGISDLKHGKIKFIGSANKRIQEDYLRILRYFRFFINYSKIEHDENVLRCIKQNINGLNKISNERIFSELNKILSSEKIFDFFYNKDSKEIIFNIFPQFIYSKRLDNLRALDQKILHNFDSILILAILIIDESKNYEYFCYKYKLSNNIKDRFRNISENYENLKNIKFFSKDNIKKKIYLTNKTKVQDLLLFSMCLNKKIKNLQELLAYNSKCEVPKFPFSGDELKKYGYETGEVLGRKLKSLEEKWVSNNFSIDKKEVEKFLGKTN